MNQPELTLSTPLPSVTRKAPRLWVKELAVYREWSPDALQRRISLRTGLNIIWAEPSPRGAAGHAAGKTTFCRFVRYLLGDSNYGSDTFRDAFRLKFPNAWIVGEVCVDGESWLVARFSGITGPTHWSARGATFDQLFDPDLPHQHYAEFTRQLTDAFIQPLPIAEFPSSGKEVSWIHLLAWLTRDQEARYDHVLDWRSGYSGATGLGDIHNADRTLLIRAVLGLIQDGEINARNAHMLILRDKRETDELIPKLAFALQRADREYKRLMGEQENDLKGDFLTEALKQYAQETACLAKRVAELRRQESVPVELTTKRDEIVGQIAKLTADMEPLQAQIKGLEMKVKLKEGTISQEEYNKQLGDVPPPSNRCGAFLTDPEVAQCPKAKALHPNRFSEQQLLQLQSTVEQEKSHIESLKKELDLVKQSKVAAEKAKSSLEKRITTAKEKHTKTTEDFEDLLDKARDKQQATQRLKEAIQELADEKEKQARLTERQRTSNDKQDELRKQASVKLSQFCEIYSSVVHRILQTEHNGRVKFGAEDITLEMDYNDLTSTALVTLKILILDLAALLASTRGADLHPGFMIHDSPREADLTAAIYHRIFEVAQKEEAEVELSPFQYIITTTEPPPTDLNRKPWLVHPAFSSAEKERRFLGENL